MVSIIILPKREYHMPISKRKCVFFSLTWLQSWIIHYSDLPRRGVRGLRVPDTPLPPFPPHHFFFLSSLQLTPITGSKTLPRKLSDSQEIKGVSRRLHAYLLLDESQLLFDEYLKEKKFYLRKLPRTVKCFEESLWGDKLVKSLEIF